MSEHEELADWDGAYVLGALNPADRRRFEAHLDGCVRCRTAVAELAGLPGLLGALPAAEALALLGEGESAGTGAAGGVPDAASGPPSDLEHRLVARIRRRRRLRTWAYTAAAAGLVAAAGAAAIVLPTAIDDAQHPAAVVALDPVGASPVAASVRVTGRAWGTEIAMTCTYRASAASETPYASSPRFGLYAIDRSGSAQQVSTWTAVPDHAITVDGAIATPRTQITRVELRALDTGTVLLAASVPGEAG